MRSRCNSTLRSLFFVNFSPVQAHVDSCEQATPAKVSAAYIRMSRVASDDSNASCTQPLSELPSCVAAAPGAGARGTGHQVHNSDIPTTTASHSCDGNGKHSSSSSSPVALSEHGEAAFSASNSQSSNLSPRSPTTELVHVSKPLFAGPTTLSSVLVDGLTLVWAYITHLLLTAWPYVSIVIMAGTPATRCVDH
jgi:hypothetical protein